MNGRQPYSLNKNKTQSKYPAYKPNNVDLIESYMGMSRRLVCPARVGTGVDPSPARGPTSCWPDVWTNQSSIPAHVSFFFLPLPSKLYLL